MGSDSRFASVSKEVNESGRGRGLRRPQEATAAAAQAASRQSLARARGRPWVTIALTDPVRNKNAVPRPFPLSSLSSRRAAPRRLRSAALLRFAAPGSANTAR